MIFNRKNQTSPWDDMSLTVAPDAGGVKFEIRDRSGKTCGAVVLSKDRADWIADCVGEITGRKLMARSAPQPLPRHFVLNADPIRVKLTG